MSTSVQFKSQLNIKNLENVKKFIRNKIESVVNKGTASSKNKIINRYDSNNSKGSIDSNESRGSRKSKTGLNLSKASSKTYKDNKNLEINKSDVSKSLKNISKIKNKSKLGDKMSNE